MLLLRALVGFKLERRPAFPTEPRGSPDIPQK
jgi:hypothetical protein